MQFPTLRLDVDDDIVDRLGEVVDVSGVDAAHGDATVGQQVDVVLLGWTKREAGETEEKEEAHSTNTQTTASERMRWGCAIRTRGRRHRHARIMHMALCCLSS